MPGADLDLLTAVALKAGTIARQYFGNQPAQWDKSDNQGPVTEADIAVNDMMLETLGKERPDYGWLSEETEDDARRLDTEAVFIVDPIDGTRAFIEGHKNFSHALAISRGGVITEAVVHLPILSATFSARLGEGAFLNGKPIRVAPRARLRGADILSNKSNLEERFWPGGSPEINRHFRSSLAYRMSLVGQGRFDGMLTLRDTWEWDIAAGTLIVEEAGGVVTTRNGAALRFNNSVPKLPGVLAAPPPIHSALMARLAS